MESDDVRRFRALHHRDRVLCLSNVWDAASAALVRAGGAEAIATTSAGVAWAWGYPDGDAIPPEERTAAIRAIRRAAGSLPLSVDFESGYSGDPDAVAALVCELRSLGVAGINLEDGDGTPELLERKIVAIKRALHDAGDDIFVNARTDGFLHEPDGGERVRRETIERARRYEAAGADGIFVPLVREPADIEAIVKATPLPLNVLATAGLPSQERLYAQGARRFSAGSSIALKAYAAASPSPERVTYGFMNALFSGEEA